MRIFISEFLTTPFLDENLKENTIPYLLFEEVLNKTGICEKEIDLIYLFGVKEKDIRKFFKKNSHSILSFENKTSTIVSAFISACEILKFNKANAVLFLSLNNEKRKNPFLKEKNKYLKIAKKFGINRQVLDEILIKSYFNFEQLSSKETLKEVYQPIFFKNEDLKIFFEDHFFLKNITRENLNLSNLISDKPWEIFTEYHFAKSATGGTAIILVNEDFVKDKNLKDLSEIYFFSFTREKKLSFPMNFLDLLSQTKEFYYKAVFSSVPCIFDEVLIRSFFSDVGLQKEVLSYAITLEEINPLGSDLFWGWADGSCFLRRLGFLKKYLLWKKGRGILIEKIPYGPYFFLEVSA